MRIAPHDAVVSLFSEQPHWLDSNDLVGTLGAGPHPEGVGWPALWWRTSHDVLARLLFSKRADPFPRLTAAHHIIKELRPHCTSDQVALPHVLREINGRAEALPEKPA